MAFAKWDDTLMFIENTLKHNEIMGTFLEVNLPCQIHALKSIVRIEQELFFFSDMSSSFVGRKFEHLPKASLCLLSLASVASWVSPNWAWIILSEQKRPSPSPTGLCLSLRTNMATTQRKSSLDSLLAALPHKPHTMSGFHAWQGPQAQCEHWIIRELGFKGDFPYSDKITGMFGIYLTQKQHSNRSLPGPRNTQLGAVKPEVLQKWVEKYRKEVNRRDVPGIGQLMMWIALGQDMIGEESVHDDPQAVRMLERMSLGGVGGCPTQ
ncbi:hypothetical protein G6011_09438 [Alternaria panax]|uniref:Uncharacterized protein n=1 Tax=Alternaria panax TaxID=48097 RepID=A0AAD4NRC4_9PLEO|nr:hypothetical protein G6011_09438 [Alternaria panax]